jgi:hypothetical protein
MYKKLNITNTRHENTALLRLLLSQLGGFMDDKDETKFFTGLINGLLLSIPLWLGILALVKWIF